MAEPNRSRALRVLHSLTAPQLQSSQAVAKSTSRSLQPEGTGPRPGPHERRRRPAGPLSAGRGRNRGVKKAQSASPTERGEEQSSCPGLGDVNRPRQKKNLWYLLWWQVQERRVNPEGRGSPARPLGTAAGPGRLVPMGKPCPALCFYSLGGVTIWQPEGNSSPKRSCSQIQVICII